MIVHGATLSPFVRKVVVFAAEKGVELTVKPTGMGPKSPEFLAMSPFGKIPAFEDGDYKLADSTAIVTYIEAKHPEPALIPAEARARGKAMWFDEYADTLLAGQLGTIFFQRVVAPMVGLPQDLAAADQAEAELAPKHFAYLESVIPESGYLVEDRMTLADVAVASPLVNMMHAGVAIDAGMYPRLAAYATAMHSRPSFTGVLAGELKMMGK